MSRPDTETLDRLYLEWSNFTEARNFREIDAARLLAQIVNACPDMPEHLSLRARGWSESVLMRFSASEGISE